MEFGVEYLQNKYTSSGSIAPVWAQSRSRAGRPQDHAQPLILAQYLAQWFSNLAYQVPPL